MGIFRGRRNRTGALPVKLSHPVAAWILFVIFLAGVFAAGWYLENKIRTMSLEENATARNILIINSCVAAFIAVGVLLYIARRAIQATSATRPGGVTIAMAAKPEDPAADQFASRLREALTAVQLSGPSVVPGESARQDFLTEVSAVAETAGGPWAALARVFSVLKPPGAYRASCTLHVDAHRQRKGVTVEVSGRLGHDLSVATIWGEKWDAVIQRAACNIAAYVLPRTSASRRPPWASWHGIKLDPGLFYQFQEARSLAREGRLEEALHHFDESIARDPFNPYIRIEKATVLDQLGLWIDALATYVDVVVIESWYDRRLWNRYRRILGDESHEPPSWFARSPNGPAALQLARYRMICTLAASERLSNQWHHNTSGDVTVLARKREVNQIIAGLRPLLPSFAKLMMRGYGHHQKAKSRKPGEQESNESGKLKIEELEKPALLRRILQFVALEECVALERDYSWLRARRWFRFPFSQKPKLPINQKALRVIPVWAALQYRYIELVQQQADEIPSKFKGRLEKCWHEHRCIGRLCPRVRLLERVNKAVPGIPRYANPDNSLHSGRNTGMPGQEYVKCLNAWPPEPQNVRDLMRKALSPHLFSAHGWHEHYNAACTYAVSMLTPDIYSLMWDELKGQAESMKALTSVHDRHDMLVRYAIHELSQAVTATDSQFAGGQPAVWLKRGDQDLDDLRPTLNYAVFMERYFPTEWNPLARSSASGTPRNPVEPRLHKDPTILTLSEHMIRLLKQYADLRSSFWQEQVRASSVSAATLHSEPEWWTRLQAFCRDFGDWRTRWQLISLAARHSERIDQFDPSIPKFDHMLPGPLPAIGPDPDARTEQWLHRARKSIRYASEQIAVRDNKISYISSALNKYVPQNSALFHMSPPLNLQQSPNGKEGEIARQLAATWRAVAAVLRDNSGEAEEKSLERHLQRLVPQANNVELGP